MNLHLLLVRIKSFIQILKNKGPKIDPCGTPLTISVISEQWLLKTTYCFRLVK